MSIAGGIELQKYTYQLSSFPDESPRKVEAITFENLGPFMKDEFTQTEDSSEKMASEARSSITSP